MYKYTKTFDEYVKIFKIKCEELGRLITTKELVKHIFDLPSYQWFIKNCPDSCVKTYRNFIEWLGFENSRRKYTYEIAYEEFAKRGFYLPPQEYTSCAIPLMYICPRHPDKIQYKSLNNLLFNVTEGFNGCYYCCEEDYIGETHARWHGGISPLHIYLREFIDDWKKDSASNCNYKCVITGERFNAIHHLYSFNKILKEVIDECGLLVHKNVGDYTMEELKLLKSKNREIHGRYPLGICLCKEVHDLYHNLYKNDNTPEQFEEFKVRYNNGEFINGIVIDIDTSKLSLGLIVNSYKDLCLLLSIKKEVKVIKKRQLLELEKFFKYHKEGNKFIIDEIF